MRESKRECVCVSLLHYYYCTFVHEVLGMAVEKGIN